MKIMTDKSGYRSLKTETIIYSPLLIRLQYDNNSSSCPDPINKKCMVCGEIFDVDMTTEEEIKHIDSHSDAELIKMIISHLCISEINPIKDKLMEVEIKND